MTKEITKAYILQQIQDKFKLRDLEPEIFRFSETVVPIYDIEPHIKTPYADHETVSVTATGGYLFFTVPQNERWELLRYNIVFVTGSYKVTGAYILRVNGKSGNFTYIDMTKEQTVSYAVDLPKAVRLEAGDQIKIYVDSYTSTGDLRMYGDLIKEEIR